MNKIFFVLMMLFICSGFFVVAADSEEDPNLKFKEELGNIEGVEFNLGDDTKWDSEKNIVAVNGVDVDLNKVKEYQKRVVEGGKADYSFGGKKYDTSLGKLIGVEGDGKNVIFKYEFGESFSFSKGSEFDPLTKKFRFGNGDEYEWMGGGSVEIEGSSSSMRLGFVPNKENSGDLTNFAIVKDSGGRQLSQFQGKILKSFKLTEKINKPKSGVVSFEQGGKYYSMDSYGNVRGIDVAEFKLDSGKVVEISGGLIDDEKGRFYAMDKFSLVEKKGNYIVSENGVLTIRSVVGKPGFIYRIKENLDKLDVKGDGMVINGDKFLEYKGGEIFIKSLGSKWQKNKGDFAFSIDDVVMYKKDGKVGKSVKILKGKDGKFGLFDSEGKVINMVSGVAGGIKGIGSIINSGGGSASEQATHQAINSVRGKELKWDEKIAEVCRQHSMAMANRGSIGHDGFSSRLSQIGCGGAENVAMFGGGSSNPTSVGQKFTDMWMNSPGHRNNIMGGYTKTGIGIVTTSSGTYATQIFC